jgi:ABC-type molybdenum transport system ATPase subunit/photorepair protein PhrA
MILRTSCLAFLLANLVTTSQSFGLNVVQQRSHSGQINKQNFPRHVASYSYGNANTSLNSSTLAPPTAQEDGLEVGDTKGAAIVFENIAISRGSNRILSNVNWRVERNQRWGIVGPNGAGKSTLLVSGELKKK